MQFIIGQAFCGLTDSSYSASIRSPESTSRISRHPYVGLCLHDYMDLAGQDQVAPAAEQGLEVARGAVLVDLQTPLADGPDFAVHRQEALLIHLREKLQGL